MGQMDSKSFMEMIEVLVKEVDPKEVGIFISLLSHRYIQEQGITKEQFMTSLSNSIDELEKEKNN